jgi:hypothetical protein
LLAIAYYRLGGEQPAMTAVNMSSSDNTSVRL